MRNKILILMTVLIVSGCTKVKPGQVWVCDISNPFTTKLLTNEVIWVRGGWVQFRDSYGTICEEPTDMFTFSSRVIKDAK